MSHDRPKPDAPTAAEVVSQNLREMTDKLERLEPAVRADEYDAVHRARTTTRRLRSLLAFGGGLLQDETASAELALKSLGRELGRARDTEVRVDLIGRRLGRKKGKALRKKARQKHRRAHDSLVDVLEHGLLTTTIVALEDLSPTPSKAGRRPAVEVLPPLITAELDHVRELAGKARRARSPAKRDEWLHEVRKASRSVRYAAEAAVGRGAVDDEDAANLAEAAEAVQDTIGEWRDLSLLADWAEARPKRSRSVPRKRIRGLRTAADALDAERPRVVAELTGPEWELTPTDNRSTT